MPVLTFDDAPNAVCLNTRYQAQGVAFSRDDLACVMSLDWSLLGRSTTSAPNVIATVSGTVPPFPTTFVSHLNIDFADDVCGLSLFLGNDQEPRMTWSMTVYDSAGQFVGSRVLVSNGNTSVDELLEISGVGAFRHARVEGANRGFAVVADDLSFTRCSIVEIPTLSASGPVLLGALLLIAAFVFLRR